MFSRKTKHVTTPREAVTRHTDDRFPVHDFDGPPEMYAGVRRQALDIMYGAMRGINYKDREVTRINPPGAVGVALVQCRYNRFSNLMIQYGLAEQPGDAGDVVIRHERTWDTPAGHALQVQHLTIGTAGIRQFGGEHEFDSVVEEDYILNTRSLAPIPPEDWMKNLAGVEPEAL